MVFEPKTVFFATANPIDYTHAGKIIEPLYDRLKSHIHTHYPKTIEDEMAIILQEAKIPFCLVPHFVLKTLARIVHKSRNHPEVNQAKGVSVRFGIHGLEILVGESERARAIPHNTVAVLRHSDMYYLSQIAKFELSEMDDTLENRQKVFLQVLEESIRETCLEYVQGVDAETLGAIKAEFAGKTFQVSPQTIWRNGATSYENQLTSFSKLAHLVISKVEQIHAEQQSLESALKSYDIDASRVQVKESFDDELKSSITEIMLDGLCHVEPKVLDKKESSYVAS